MSQSNSTPWMISSRWERNDGPRVSSPITTRRRELFYITLQNPAAYHCPYKSVSRKCMLYSNQTRITGTLHENQIHFWSYLYQFFLWCTIYLTAIGLTTGGSGKVHIYTQTIHRTTQSTQILHRTTQFTN